MTPSVSPEPSSILSTSRYLLLWLGAGIPLIAAETQEPIPAAPPQENTFVQGRRPDSFFSWDYVRLAADDTVDIVTSPARWERDDWLIAGGLGALVVSSTALDGQIREESQEHRSKNLNSLTKTAQGFGAEYSVLLIGGFEAYGYLAHDDKAKAVAMDSVTSSIIASGIIAPLLKYTVGRVRPTTSNRVFDFKPFSGNDSFPSGHTTQAFAVAAVISAHYDEWWVKGLSFGVAGLVGYSRIQQNAHFTSDVVAGAIIGTTVGHAIVKRHNQPKPADLKISPYFNGRIRGLAFSKEF